ncbi:PREDICTED: nuclear fragile X mental retardation-interacting protein 2-like [Poecilia mexicana]|uniref:Nuclear FMR1 interacting protein 2 n=1 Tax=Poecilia mexicana TaxID=48701 RepID=A0A3B3YFE7_9TELE|nr:PREDICTED: nuclear fragile X mental retardation-interacting protein 2-like [Poecilia mexicana]XP_014858522.1 PREDICTED: nuclear fragile X mental retardation-interacting protein 2-like [Poecilia mexicana]
MEEQPKDRAQDRQHHHNGEDRSSIQRTACLKHDQSQFQCQHQETQAKKTGSKNVNISDEEGEKNPHLPYTVGMSHSSSSNDNRHISNPNVKQKGLQKHYTSVQKVSSKFSEHKKNMDLKNDKEKALDLSHYEIQPSDKKDSALLQNGLVNCGLITNGYSSKDNDGSGSEGGYTTPKKRKSRCGNTKSADNVTKDKERDMQPRHTTQEPGASSVETPEKGIAYRLDGFRSGYKAEAQTTAKRAVASETSVAEPQRKTSEGKAAGTFGKKAEEKHKGKLSSPSKEDSWTLFKPPPVFPVDNSSAKIVPKISYASKVKENLNKVAQGGGEAAPPPVRLSQVPMSAMKTITSASFTNGPVPGNGNGCPSVGTFFAPAASCVQSAPSVPSGENVASSLESSCSSTTSPVDGEASELRKCTVLIYPLNMQPVLPSARHLDPPAAQTNQKALGDIFQNQWGLSFINEPNPALDGGNGFVPAEDQTSVTSHNGSQAVPAKVAQPLFDISPFLEAEAFSQEAEKRTCAPCQVSSVCSPASTASEEETKLQPSVQEKTKVELKGVGSSLLGPSKDNGAKPAVGQQTTVLFGSSKEQIHPKDVGRRSSWGSFDLKAAVTYHTKEMESIFNLQKQDPKRIVFYDETKDGPDQ